MEAGEEGEELPWLPQDLRTEIFKRTDLATCYEHKQFEAAKSFLSTKDDRDRALLDVIRHKRENHLLVLVHLMKIAEPFTLIQDAAARGHLQSTKWLIWKLYMWQERQMNVQSVLGLANAGCINL